MAGKGSSWHDKGLHRTVALVTEAMDLIDAHGGPPEAAAHLEMARQLLLAAKGHRGSR
jgi:hypothetical protein